MVCDISIKNSLIDNVAKILGNYTSSITQNRAKIRSDVYKNPAKYAELQELTDRINLYYGEKFVFLNIPETADDEATILISPSDKIVTQFFNEALRKELDIPGFEDRAAAVKSGTVSQILDRYKDETFYNIQNIRDILNDYGLAAGFFYAETRRDADGMPSYKLKLKRKYNLYRQYLDNLDNCE